MTRPQVAIWLGAVTTLAACGGNNQPHPAPSRTYVLRLSCDQSWVPNRRTFADPRWRQRSLRIGPVTFIEMRRAAARPVARYGSIKFRTLVQPNTPVVITIGEAARHDVGFYPGSVESGGRLPPHAKPVLALAGCAGLRNRPVGYPVFFAVARDRCLPLTVTAAGRRPVSRFVSLGAGGCG